MRLMKAAISDGDKIIFGDYVMPQYSNDAVPVQMCAAALTNLDIIAAAGKHYLSPKTFPAVAGNEGVARLPDGQRRYFPVASLVAPFGSMADHSLGRVEKSLPVLPELPDACAAAVGNAGLAGWLPFSWQARLQPGETVLILGATGASGLIAVAAARLLGAGRIIAAGRNPKALAKAKEMGADITIDIDDNEGLTTALKDASVKDVDVMVDYLNGPATTIALNFAGEGGRLVQIGSALGPNVCAPASLLRKQNLSIMGFAYYHAPYDKQVEAYLALSHAVLDGAVFIDLEEMPLSNIEQAWTRQKSERGPRLVLIPD